MQHSYRGITCPSCNSFPFPQHCYHLTTQDIGVVFRSLPIARHMLDCTNKGTSSTASTISIFVLRCCNRLRRAHPQAPVLSRTFARATTSLQPVNKIKKSTLKQREWITATRPGWTMGYNLCCNRDNERDKSSSIPRLWHLLAAFVRLDQFEKLSDQGPMRRCRWLITVVHYYNCAVAE